jgi:hypothetical protein
MLVAIMPSTKKKNAKHASLGHLGEGHCRLEVQVTQPKSRLDEGTIQITRIVHARRL